MPSAGFETAIPVIERVQTYAIKETASGIEPRWLLALTNYKIAILNI
jgi:hypothetical protein